MSSFPSPSVFQTAFSSSVRPVTLILVPPPLCLPPSVDGWFLRIFPNSTRLGGIRWPAYLRGQASASKLVKQKQRGSGDAREVEKSPPGAVRVRFGDLEQRLLRLVVVGIGQRQLINRMLDPLVPDRPPQVPASLAPDRVSVEL